MKPNLPENVKESNLSSLKSKSWCIEIRELDRNCLLLTNDQSTTKLRHCRMYVTMYVTMYLFRRIWKKLKIPSDKKKPLQCEG